jgi:hypothetical protein
MRVPFDMTRINHQPCKIRLSHQVFSKRLPDAAITPAAESAVRILPIAIVRRQIAPRSAWPQNPEHGVDE